MDTLTQTAALTSVGLGASQGMNNWRFDVPGPEASERLHLLIRFLVELASRSDGTPSDQPAYGASIVELATKGILSASPQLLRDAFSDRQLLCDAIGMFKRLGAIEVLWCIASSIDFSAGLATKEYVCKEALNVDLTLTHSWMKSADLVHERLLMNRIAVEELSYEGGCDRSLFRAIKRHEAAILRASGVAPTVASTLEACRIFRRAPRDDQDAAQTPTAEAEGDFLPLIHPHQRTLQSLAFHAPEFLEELFENLDPASLLENIDALQKLVPVYLVITDLGYPMGGGESFMHQTCRILSEIGYRCIWVSFSSKGIPYTAAAHSYTPFFEEVRVTGGFSVEVVERLIERFQPDIVHTQGGSNPFVGSAAAAARVPVLIGYHFWNGLVQLDRETKNTHILDWIERHKPVETLLKKYPRYVKSYVASEFMLDVYRRLGGRGAFDVHHPISDPSHYLLDAAPAGDKVVQINVAEGKGGRIFLDCLRQLGDQIPFCAIQTEPRSEDLDEDIRREIKQHPLSEYNKYGSIKSYFAQARMVIVPTLVDETFCRVAFEAAMNGIPVLSTRNGFLPQLLGDTGYFLSENPDDWIRAIRELYWDTEKLKNIGEKQRSRLSEKFGLYPREFCRSVIELTKQSPRRNLGFFVPWSEQGLGEVARTYVKLFRKMGVKAHVLSFQSYAARDNALAVQSRPEDWAVGTHADSIHYSFNDRERVTLYEMEQFVRTNNIGRFIYPEICFPFNWKKIANFIVRGASVVAVPMIETVRRPEILNHNGLARTWCNTRQCLEVMRSHGVRNAVYIGHGFGRKLSESEVEDKVQATRSRKGILFSHIGGHNAVSRKQTPKVIAAFMKAAEAREDIRLKICLMNFSDMTLSEHPRIEYVISNLRHEDIIDTYRQSDVSIQISSHEGLGLGFYESVSVGTPVVSVDVAPHNEVVQPSVSGWLISSKPVALHDNNEAVVGGNEIDVNELADLLSDLTKPKIAALIPSTAELFNRQFSEPVFSLRLARAL
jgi:glycosyltransferase involved in cell wall biosynthesis